MFDHDFDLYELLEEVAIECSREAELHEDALFGGMDPELSRIYFGKPEALSRLLKKIMLRAVNDLRDSDISLFAGRPFPWKDETTGAVKVQFSLESSTAGGEQVIEHYKFSGDLVAAQTQPPVPLYLSSAKPLPIFFLSPRSAQCTSIQGILRHWGLRCDSACSIHEAIVEITRQATLEQPYKVILVAPPTADGVPADMAKEIKASALARVTRLVHIDRFHSDVAREASFAAGFDAYLARPFRTNQLLELLVELIGEELLPALSKGAPAVLIVEDNLTNQKLATLLLRRMGITADVVTNGREALEALERKNFDLVLLDYQMPVMDGYETLVQIRSQPRLRLLPVILLTSNGDAETISRCWKAGMSEFVPKPITARRMQEIVSKWCGFPNGTHFRISA
jgi:CheY-like chemotaxis protein